MCWDQLERHHDGWLGDKPQVVRMVATRHREATFRARVRALMGIGVRCATSRFFSARYRGGML